LTKAVDVPNAIDISNSTLVIRRLQVIRIVFVENKMLFALLNGHIVATPNILGVRKQPMVYPVVTENFVNTIIEYRTLFRQQVRKENGIGLEVGGHSLIVFRIFFYNT